MTDTSAEAVERKAEWLESIGLRPEAATLRALLAERDRLLEDVRKLRRFLQVSRDEGAEALEKAERLEQERDEARRQVRWLSLFGTVAGMDDAYRAELKETGHD